MSGEFVSDEQAAQDAMELIDDLEAELIGKGIATCARPYPIVHLRRRNQKRNRGGYPRLTAPS